MCGRTPRAAVAGRAGRRQRSWSGSGPGWRFGSRARIERADATAALLLRYRPLLLAQAKAHECAVLEADALGRFDAVMATFTAYLLRERLLSESEQREAIGQRDMALAIAPFSGCDQAMRNMGGNGWIQAQAIRHRLIDLGLLSDETTTGP